MFNVLAVAVAAAVTAVPCCYVRVYVLSGSFEAQDPYVRNVVLLRSHVVCRALARSESC